MKVLFFSTKSFEKPFLVSANQNKYCLDFTENPLSLKSIHLAKGFEVISIFTGDDASAPVVRELSKIGVKFIAIRAAGYDTVDLDAAEKYNIQVANVPDYSPYAIAEHAVALILSLNRKILLSQEQLHKQDFTLDNLIGFDLNKTTVGIIGTGKIGSVFARIMHGFGCKILAYDLKRNLRLIDQYDVRYADLGTVCSQSDIISIHTPLTKDTRHLISASLIQKMKHGVMLINTSRGAVVKTEDIANYLMKGHIGYYGMDVYEKEQGVFFFNLENQRFNDPVLQKLMLMPNVLVTPHQAFATKEALTNIATTTFENIEAWANYSLSGNELTSIAELKTIA